MLAPIDKGKKLGVAPPPSVISAATIRAVHCPNVWAHKKPAMSSRLLLQDLRLSIDDPTSDRPVRVALDVQNLYIDNYTLQLVIR